MSLVANRSIETPHETTSMISHRFDFSEIVRFQITQVLRESKNVGQLRN
jgi:hypothetical protein